MTARTARATLCFIWLFGFLASLALLGVFFAKGWMLTENLKKNFATATGIFAPYLTPIIMFWFTKRRVKEDQGSGEGYLLAIVLSAVFNVAVLLLILNVFLQSGEGLIESMLDLAAYVATGLAFLTGPAIGYYFAKQ